MACYPQMSLYQVLRLRGIGSGFMDVKLVRPTDIVLQHLAAHN